MEIRPDSPLVVTGKPLAFHVAATYYFGGPVAGAKIKYRLERQPIFTEPSPPEDAETESTTSRWYRSFVSQGTVEAGADGKARIEVPTALDKGEQGGDALFILSAEVVGEEGRVVEGEGTATVTRSTFGVYVEPLSLGGPRRASQWPCACTRWTGWEGPIPPPCAFAWRRGSIVRAPGATTSRGTR